MAASTLALRLFARNDPSRQIDLRVLGEREEITLGRDQAADWALADPDRSLSRLHLKVGLQAGVIRVTDTSTNGVTSSGTGGRLPKDEPVSVHPGERLELGPYVLLIERSERAPNSASLDAPPSRGVANPFAPLGEEDGPSEPKRRPNPFASELKPDLDRFGSLGGGPGAPGDLMAGRGRGAAGGLLEADAWERRPGVGAGDWNAAPPRSEPIIGAPGPWMEPPAEPRDEKGFGFDAPFRQPILRAPAVRPDDLAIPSDWDQPSAPAPSEAPGPAVAPPSPFEATREPPAERPEPPVRPASGALPPQAAASVQELSPAAPSPPGAQPAQAELFAAFCRGAKLDAAALAGEDSAVLMERVGVIYRQMVLGLSDVLGERTALKNEYRMVRTTIQAEENNPLKWAPAQKAASELLRGAHEGFLDGPQAVAQSYQDIKKHLLCMLAGLRASLSSSLDALSPERIEEAVKDQAFMLKPRAAVAWGEYQRVYAQFRREAEDSADSPVNREFRAAYEKQLDELDRMALR